MSAFQQWAAIRDCALIALATRRAAPFYRALGYEESAVYFRKILDDQAGNGRVRGGRAVAPGPGTGSRSI
jgi:hypothetical protein